MIFHLVPHLPWLLAMVAKFFMRKWWLYDIMILLWYYDSIYFNISVIFSIFIDNQGKHGKMQKKFNIHCYSYQVKSNYIIWMVCVFWQCVIESAVLGM